MLMLPFIPSSSRARWPGVASGQRQLFGPLRRGAVSPADLPPPIPGALGIHYRRDLGGLARFGPDLEFVDELDYTIDPARLSYFEEYLRRFWPGLPDDALSPDFAGIRPKLHGPGEAQGDFVIDASQKFVIALFGIESPGLTASLAIGEHVAGLAAR